MTFADDLGVFVTTNLYRSLRENRVKDCRNFAYVRINQCAHGGATYTINANDTHTAHCKYCAKEFEAEPGETLLPEGYEYTIGSSDVSFTARYRYINISLADNASNWEALSTYNGKFAYSVTLEGRTLYKDGDWNTLCLPFGVEDFSGTIFEGATVKELDTEGEFDGHQTGYDNGTLYLYFQNATEIVAGKPYLVKWASGENIVSPVFTNVTINNTSNTVTSTDGKMSLLGNYSPVALTAGDNTVLYLGTHNKLYYPSKARTLNSFRAYFQLNGIVAGDPQSGQQSIQSFKHNLDDEATGVASVHSAQCTVHCSPRKVIKDGRLYIGEYNIAGQRTK